MDRCQLPTGARNKRYQSHSRKPDRSESLEVLRNLERDFQKKLHLSGKGQSHPSEIQLSHICNNKSNRNEKDRNRVALTTPDSSIKIDRDFLTKTDQRSSVSRNHRQIPENLEELCFICAEKIVFTNLAPCNHRFCHKCALRLWVLYEVKSCAYCKSELKVLYIVYPSAKLYEEYDVSNFLSNSDNDSVKYESKDIEKRCFELLSQACPLPGCYAWSRSLQGTKLHIAKVHGKLLCDLCLQHNKKFSREYKVYSPIELSSHYLFGESSTETGFKGHPKCKFCDLYFYGEDEFFVHCREFHEKCHLCDQAQNDNATYFATWDDLERHFYNDHFPCTHSDCLEKKFVVFNSVLDLRAHQIEEHHEVNHRNRKTFLDLTAHYIPKNNIEMSGKNGRRNQSTNQTSSTLNNIQPRKVDSFLNNEEEFPALNKGTEDLLTRGMQFDTHESEIVYPIILKFLKHDQRQFSSVRPLIDAFLVGKINLNGVLEKLGHSVNKSSPEFVEFEIQLKNFVRESQRKNAVASASSNRYKSQNQKQIRNNANNMTARDPINIARSSGSAFSHRKSEDAFPALPSKNAAANRNQPDKKKQTNIWSNKAERSDIDNYSGLPEQTGSRKAGNKSEKMRGKWKQILFHAG